MKWFVYVVIWAIYQVLGKRAIYYVKLWKTLSKDSKDALGVAENNYCIARHGTCVYSCTYSTVYPKFKICTPINIFYSGPFLAGSVVCKHRSYTYCVDRIAFHEVWPGDSCPLGSSQKIGCSRPIPICQKSYDNWGGVLILLFEVIFFQSWPIAVWMMLFLLLTDFISILLRKKAWEKGSAMNTLIIKPMCHAGFPIWSLGD